MPCELARCFFGNGGGENDNHGETASFGVMSGDFPPKNIISCLKSF
jgi:hypothetical protein